MAVSQHSQRIVEHLPQEGFQSTLDAASILEATSQMQPSESAVCCLVTLPH